MRPKCILASSLIAQHDIDLNHDSVRLQVSQERQSSDFTASTLWLQ
jgi:hypothetical protein